MTKDRFVELVMQGKFLALGEYRSSRCEFREWRDRATQRVMSGNFLRHTVELDGVPVSISDKVAEGMKASEYRSPFEKGEPVVIHLRQLKEEKGSVTAFGMLEKYDSPAPTVGPVSKPKP